MIMEKWSLAVGRAGEAAWSASYRHLRAAAGHQVQLLCLDPLLPGSRCLESQRSGITALVVAVSVGAHQLPPPAPDGASSAAVAGGVSSAVHLRFASRCDLRWVVPPGRGLPRPR